IPRLAGGRRPGPGPGYRHLGRHRRRAPGGGHGGHPEDRRHGGPGHALPTDPPLRDGQEEGRVADLPLLRRDPHRHGHGLLRAGALPGGGIGALSSAHHRQRGQRRRAGDHARHPRHGALRGAHERLVEGGPEGILFGARPRVLARSGRDRLGDRLGTRPRPVWRALPARGPERRAQSRGRGDLGHARGIDPALRPAQARPRSGERLRALRGDARRRGRRGDLLFRRQAGALRNPPLNAAAIAAHRRHRDPRQPLPGRAMTTEFRPSEIEIPELLPVLPIRGAVVFPLSVVPVSVGQPQSIRMVEEVMQGDRLVAVVAQKNEEAIPPGVEDLYRIGTAAIIRQYYRTEMGNLQLILQWLVRVEVEEYVGRDLYPVARYRVLGEELGDDLRVQALSRAAKERFRRLAELTPELPEELANAIRSFDEPLQLSYLLATTVPLPTKDRQSLLEAETVEER